MLVLAFLTDIAVRLYGLGWRSFISNGWSIYDLIVVPGAFATTIPILIHGTIQVNQTVLQLQKVSPRTPCDQSPTEPASVQLFLVAIAFKIVERNDALNQLFKTSASGLPQIGRILLLWAALFLVRSWSITAECVLTVTISVLRYHLHRSLRPYESRTEFL